MEEKKKSNIGLIITIIILSLIILGLVGFIAYDKGLIFSKDSNVEEMTEKKIEDNEDEEVNTNLDFDFDEMEKFVKEELIKAGIDAYYSSCEDERPEGSSEPNFVSSTKKLTSDSFDKLLKTLKKAKSYKIGTTHSAFCAPHLYSIGKLKDPTTDEMENRSIIVFGNGSVLAVGYKDEGYDFEFESSEDVQSWWNSIK